MYSYAVFLAQIMYDLIKGRQQRCGVVRIGGLASLSIIAPKLCFYPGPKFNSTRFFADFFLTFEFVTVPIMRMLRGIV